MSHIVTEKAQRPASMNGTCFYCKQPIGAEHLHDCVLIERKVLVRAVIEYEIAVPADWTAEQIEFHRNDGSWCADNMIPELEALTESECLCDKVLFTYLGDTSRPYLEE